MRAPLGRVVVLLAAALLAAGAAVAVEEPHGGDGVSPFAGDLGNAVWTLVIFIAVVVVLGRYAWGPLLSALQQREKFIRDCLLKAKEDREAAEARLAEYEERLRQARAEATAIVEEGRRDAEVVKARIEREAREEYERMVERARRDIDLAKGSALRELYATSASLATDIAGRILEREISTSDHERLIAEAIDEISNRKIH